MRVALAQINPVLGDFEFNKNKILEYVARAKQKHCDLVVFPEASLFGYHPVDLLERPSVVQQQMKVLGALHKKLPPGIVVIIGAITENKKPTGKAYFNSAVVLEKAKPAKVFPKQLLPTYDVFDEGRFIEPGQSNAVIKVKGQRILITICEDIWGWKGATLKGKSLYTSNPILAQKKGSVDLVVNLSASPFTETKEKGRYFVTSQVVKHLKVPMVYVNMVGAQDELIYDGGSFALDAKAQVICRCVRFSEDLNVLDLTEKMGGQRFKSPSEIENIRQALVLGIRDFVSKTGFQKVHLGLSGGLDSAVVACLAVDALGPQNVKALAMPGPYSSELSLSLAKQLAENLNIELKQVSIVPSYEQVLKDFQSTMGEFDFSVVNENFQARLRSLMLMGFSNKENSLLLNTSNKSELACGYSTLYGDLAGGLSPIGDLLKTQVYKLAEHYNNESEIIPRGVIKRSPTAELRANQTDQDSLPPYIELDKIITKLVTHCKPAKTALEKRVLEMLMKSEFKRWQAPPVLKVSDHSFGRGRRFPVAHRALV